MTTIERPRRRDDEMVAAPGADAARQVAWSDRTGRATDDSSVTRGTGDPLAWPLLGRITSRFGERGGAFHAGIDIAGPEGAPVRAAAAGRVVIAETLPVLGTCAVVDHGAGFATVSAHLCELLAAAGDHVAAGQVVGRVGATGRATGPHLHFETRLEGRPVDPSGLLPVEGDPAEALRLRTIATLGNALTDVRDVVLVGTTLHANAGDSLIWLGQLSLLKELGIRVHDVVHPASFDRRAFDAAPPGAAVLLAGGGNFGDLWPFVQRHREWVLAEITDRRVVQLPQSLHYEDPSRAARVRRMLAERRDVLLTWRDHQSLERARDLFPTTESVLVPDVAFARRLPAPAAGRATPVLCITRADCEGGALRDAMPSSTDWQLDPLPRLTRRALWLAARLERRAPVRPSRRARRVLVNRGAVLTAGAAAAQVGAAGVVVTDRLHAHVLCTMLAVPHVVLDDGYGKISAFLDTWPMTSDLAELATTPNEAVERAEAMLDRARTSER